MVSGWELCFWCKDIDWKLTWPGLQLFFFWIIIILISSEYCFWKLDFCTENWLLKVWSSIFPEKLAWERQLDSLLLSRVLDWALLCFRLINITTFEVFETTDLLKLTIFLILLVFETSRVTSYRDHCKAIFLIFILIVTSSLNRLFTLASWQWRLARVGNLGSLLLAEHRCVLLGLALIGRTVYGFDGRLDSGVLIVRRIHFRIIVAYGCSLVLCCLLLRRQIQLLSQHAERLVLAGMFDYRDTRLIDNSSFWRAAQYVVVFSFTNMLHLRLCFFLRRSQKQDRGWRWLVDTPSLHRSHSVDYDRLLMLTWFQLLVSELVQIVGVELALVVLRPNTTTRRIKWSLWVELLDQMVMLAFWANWIQSSGLCKRPLQIKPVCIVVRSVCHINKVLTCREGCIFVALG